MIIKPVPVSCNDTLQLPGALSPTDGTAANRQIHPAILNFTPCLPADHAGVRPGGKRRVACDPRTTMRCDRARKNLDRHTNYILAAYMASGT